MGELLRRIWTERLKPQIKRNKIQITAKNIPDDALIDCKLKKEDVDGKPFNAIRRMHPHVKRVASVESSTGESYQLENLETVDSGVFRLKCLECGKFGLKKTSMTFL